MIFSSLLPVSLLASLAVASPILNLRDDKTDCNATEIILKAAPKSASCANVTDFADECATAEHAAQFLPAAMYKYNITAPGAIAGVLSLMAFESGDFRYNRNHFPKPGRPGQGTRNLQMPFYNLMYAKSIPELQDRVTEIAGSETNGTSLSDDKKNQILALVMPDQYTWGSGPWFLATQCEQSVRDELALGTVKGFTLYMGCIGVEASQERVEKWTMAKAAFNMP